MIHTKSWVIHYIDEDEDWPQHLEIVDADGEEVATIVHRLGTAEGDKIPDYKYAHARLIAASPDLLDALRECVSAIDGEADYQTITEQLHDARDAARTAISAAVKN